MLLYTQTVFLGVLINWLNDLTFEVSISVFFFTDKIISSFSIILVKKYLSIRNFMASQKTLILSLFPLQVIEFPLKKTFVEVNFERFLTNT